MSNNTIQVRDERAARAFIDLLVGWEFVGGGDDGGVERLVSPRVRAHLDAVLGGLCPGTAFRPKGNHEIAALAAYLRSVADAVDPPQIATPPAPAQQPAALTEVAAAGRALIAGLKGLHGAGDQIAAFEAALERAGKPLDPAEGDLFRSFGSNDYTHFTGEVTRIVQQRHARVTKVNRWRELPPSYAATNAAGETRYFASADEAEAFAAGNGE